MILRLRGMERISWFILLLAFGVALCKPYYYRESKQHSEHHKEVSYDGSSSPVSPLAGQEGTSLLYYKPPPEKYLSAVSPIHSSDYQSQSGGYSFSHGSIQQSSPLLTPTVSRLTEYPSNGGNVVVRKYVKVYSYPATPSQAGYVHYSQSRSGSDILGNERHITNLQGNYFPTGNLHNTQQSQVHKIIRTEQSGFGGSLESGQKEESEELGQKEEVLYDNPYGGQIEVGQKEEALIGQHEVELGQKEERVYESSHSGRLELGQQEEPLVVPHSLITGKREEIVGVSSQRGDLEIGQREVPLQQPVRKQQSVSVYQREVRVQRPTTLSSGSLITGPNPTLTYSRQIQGSQQRGSIPAQVVSYHSQYSSHRAHNAHGSLESHSEESGQKEEPLNGQKEELIGQKEESLYKSSHVGHLELGQKEEPLNGQIEEALGQKEEHIDINGQKEESLYGNFHAGHLEIGQKQESLNEQQEKPIGQKEESLYESSHLEVGQKEEPLNGQIEEVLGQKEEHIDVNGQREESLYVNHQQEQLEIGQKPVPLPGKYTESIGQREESLYENQHSGQIDVGQHEETLDGTGQKEETLDVQHHNGKPVSSHHSYTAHHKEETVHVSSHNGGLELGQREEPLLIQQPSLTNHKVESLYVSNPGAQLELGQKEETSALGLGKKVEPLQSPLGKPQSFSVYHKEVHINQKPVWSQTKYSSSGPQDIQNGHVQSLATGGIHSFHDSFSSQKDSLCDHDRNYMHGGFGYGQNGHNLQISRSTAFNQEVKPDEGIVSVNRQPEVDYFSGRNKQTTIQSYSSSVLRNENVGIESSTGKVGNVITVPANKPQQGTAFDMNKKIDDLVLELGLVDNVKRTDSAQVLKTTAEENREETTPRTNSAVIHTAEIQELGIEDFNKKTFSEIGTLNGAPKRGVTVFETHKEETGLDYPSTRKSYSKKHSRQYSSTSERFSTGIQPRMMEAYSLQSPLQTSGQVSGSSYSYSQQGGSYVNDQPVQRQEVSKTEFFGGNQQGNRHAAIDEFLTELEKDIARNNKRPQSGFVSVSSQQQPATSGGSSYYSERSYSSQSSHSSSSSSSGGAGSRSWFQKVGDNIGSTYNKAVERIGTSYSQAKDKAKEIVDNVKHQVGY